MTSRVPLRMATLTAVVAAGLTTAAAAQDASAVPPRSDTMVAQAMPSGGMGQGMMNQGQGSPSGQSGMMGQGQTGQSGTMGSGMMGQGPMRPRTGMSRPMLKIMFAIADTNGDGALSFDEIMAVHRRIFNVIDANNDGRITPDELEAFLRD